MRLSLAVALTAATMLQSLSYQAVGAAQVEFTGYLVDNFCWDKPGHM